MVSITQATRRAQREIPAFTIRKGWATGSVIAGNAGLGYLNNDTPDRERPVLYRFFSRGAVPIGQRLKLSGMHWTVKGANAIIALRCCQMSNRWEEFWESRATG
jgi:hypothetical protein